MITYCFFVGLAFLGPAKRGRPKNVPALQSRYPTLTVELEVDATTYGLKVEALNKEMESAKPRKEVYLPLMKATFMPRRQWILTDVKYVMEVTSKYPALREAHVVSV